MAINAEHRSKFSAFTGNGNISNEWESLKWDEKLNTNRQLTLSGHLCVYITIFILEKKKPVVKR